MSVDEWYSAVLPFPGCAAGSRVENRTVAPGNPTFIVANEEDFLVIVNQPVAFAIKAVALFAPCFAGGFGIKNPVIFADNPASRIVDEPDAVEGEFADVFVSVPLFSAVFGIKDIGIFTDNPTFFRIGEEDISEHGIRAAPL